MTRPVWTWLPDWGAPVIERLMWLTDVQTARDGTEECRALRGRPRRTLEFQVQLFGEQAAQFDAAMWQHQMSEWLLPFWPDVGLLTVAVVPGAVGISVDTTDRGYQHGTDKWALIVGANGRHEPMEVSLFTAQALYTLTPLTEAWPVGTRVFPGHRAHLSAAQEVQRETAGFVQLQVQFDLVEPVTIPPGSMTMYQGAPVLDREPDRERPIPATYTRISARVDFEVGGFELIDHAKRPFIGRTQTHCFFSRADAAAFRQMLGELAGRLTPFWSPTWQADIEVIAPTSAGSSLLHIRRIDYQANYAGMLGRKHIMLKLRDGTVIYTEILSATISGSSTENLLVSHTFAADITPDQVIKCCWLERVRLASDVVEFEWLTAEVSQVQLSLKTIR